MRTATFQIPVVQVPAFKCSARQLEIDLIISPYEEGNEWVDAHAIIVDDVQLVSLGVVAGIDIGLNSIKNPMEQFISKTERIISEINRKQNNQNQ